MIVHLKKTLMKLKITLYHLKRKNLVERNLKNLGYAKIILLQLIGI